MTHVDLRIVNQHRSIVAAILRILGIWIILNRVLSYVLLRTLYTPNRGALGTYSIDWPQVWTTVGQSVFYVVAGCLLMLVARKLAIWIVPVPKPLCPGCQYDLSASNPPACPECGLDLSSLQSPAPDSQPRAE